MYDDDDDDGLSYSDVRLLNNTWAQQVTDLSNRKIPARFRWQAADRHRFQYDTLYKWDRVPKPQDT